MGFKKWVISDYDKELAKSLSYECETDPIVTLIASARGYTDCCELEQFLSDEPYFTDPREMADIEKAADIIKQAISDRKKIAVFGDYDCDGVCATALLCEYLNLNNADFTYYIPDRFTEGYGMNCDAVKFLYEQGVKLIITVDNGIVCFDEIALANSLGIEVVVTDHHLPKDELPNASAVVNPHRKDCPSEFKMVCGAEVAFRLICVLEDKEPEELIYYFADILAVAVIADIMPLTLENRSIVKIGIEKLIENPNVGLSALLNVAAAKRKDLNSQKVAFTICPRINAAGRMGSAKRAVELLLCKNMLEALKLANEIDDENQKRQQTEKQIYAEAVELIEREKLKYDRVIVVCGNNWHHGVVGISAARISERYGAPVILLSSDGDMAHGSARSIEGFNIYNAIASAEELLLKFGGHESAAGLSLKSENVEKIREIINAYAHTIDYVAPVLKLDLKLNPQALSLDLAFALKALEPFGTGNPLPVFGVFGVRLERITPMANNKHLKLLFSKDKNTFQAVLFSVSTDSFCFEVGDILDLAVTVEPNFYADEYTVSVQIKGIRISGCDDDAIFNSLNQYNSFFSGNDCTVSQILPTRTEVGVIYKKIAEKPILEDRIKYIFLNDIGFGKTAVAIKTLTELGLIYEKNGVLAAVNNGAKTDLLNSITFKTLTERGTQ